MERIKRIGTSSSFPDSWTPSSHTFRSSQGIKGTLASFTSCSKQLCLESSIIIVLAVNISIVLLRPPSPWLSASSSLTVAFSIVLVAFVSPLVILVFLIYLDIKTYPIARDLPHIGSSTHWNSPNQAQMVLDSSRAQALSARPLTLPTMARNRLTGHVFHNFDVANCAAFSATGAFHSETLCLH
ncbi:hypothetical protein CGCVW01_v010832 [Colletotrichum viniferum]|nr:hypothetical protein CGCVW01_v010832 [Colletotrichum viniferum]